MWIWANLEPEKLPSGLRQAFAEENSEFAISVVSVWEAMVAMEKGRVTAVASAESTVRLWLQGNPFHVIPLEPETVILSRTLPFEHEDPADRFIAATAYHLKLPLATADDRLRRLAWLPLFS